MRLQLSAAAALASLWMTVWATAAAEPTGDHADVAVRTSLYADDDATVISTTSVAVEGRATERATLRAHYVADAVSSASVDVVTAATGRWTELRSEVQGGAAWSDGTWAVTADYVHSREHDWASHTVALSGSRDLFQHNLTLALGVSAVDNQVGRAGDVTFARQQRSAGVDARAVWVASPRDLWSASYTVGYVAGYQASPYRYALVAGPAATAIGFPETAPDRRLRHAVTARWNHAVFTAAAVRSHARVYLDDWGVASMTAGTGLAVALGEHLEVEATLRGYLQRHAAFYQDVYDQPRRYLTADRELSTFRDVFAGARARWRGERVVVDAGVTGFGFWFAEFERLPRRLGVIGELGLRVAL
ncbi:MAG: DUF3570 domain-containing protein [Kofleriaceae bacterium]